MKRIKNEYLFDPIQSNDCHLVFRLDATNQLGTSHLKK